MNIPNPLCGAVVVVGNNPRVGRSLLPSFFGISSGGPRTSRRPQCGVGSSPNNGAEASCQLAVSRYQPLCGRNSGAKNGREQGAQHGAG